MSLRRHNLVAAAAAAWVGIAATQASASLLLQYSATASGSRTTLLSGPSTSPPLTTGTALVDGLTVSAFSISANSPGEAGLAYLLSSAVSVQNTTSSPVTVYFFIGDTDFTSPLTPPAPTLSNQEGGTVFAPSLGSSLSLISCLDLGNGQNTCPLGTDVTPAASSSLNVVGSFNNTTTTMISSLVAPYSISQELVLTLGPGARVNFSDSTVLTDALRVPEPASRALLGVSLLALLGIGARTGIRRG